MLLINDPNNLSFLRHYVTIIDAINNELDKKIISYNQQSLTTTNEYKLFYYIKDNFENDINYLLSKNIENDSMGFISVKRNIRISTEAFLDLYNLIHFGVEYIDFLKSKNKTNKFKNISIRKIGSYVNLDSKYKIAKSNSNFSFEITSFLNSFFNQSYSSNNNQTISIAINPDMEFYITKDETNKYIHASIEIEPNNFNYDKKISVAKSLLLIDLYLINDAFIMIQNKFNENDKYRCYYNYGVINVPGQFKRDMHYGEYYEECKRIIKEAKPLPFQTYPPFLHFQY